MTKNDKLLILSILVISMLSYLLFSLLFRGDAPLTAEISVNGDAIATINLNNQSRQRLIKISGPIGTSIAEVKPGAIRMKFSPCPDQYCMKTGWINRPGQVIACVPNRIIIRISPSKHSVDTISR